MLCLCLKLLFFNRILAHPTLNSLFHQICSQSIQFRLLHSLNDINTWNNHQPNQSLSAHHICIRNNVSWHEINSIHIQLLNHLHTLRRHQVKQTHRLSLSAFRSFPFELETFIHDVTNLKVFISCCFVHVVSTISIPKQHTTHVSMSSSILPIGITNRYSWYQFESVLLLHIRSLNHLHTQQMRHQLR